MEFPPVGASERQDSTVNEAKDAYGDKSKRGREYFVSINQAVKKFTNLTVEPQPRRVESELLSGHIHRARPKAPHERP